MKIVRLSIGIISDRADLIDNDVINHAQIAHVNKINTNVSAGFDRGLNHAAVFVHNMTRSIENVTTRSIRTVFTDNESLGRLVIGR